MLISSQLHEVVNEFYFSTEVLEIWSIFFLEMRPKLQLKFFIWRSCIGVIALEWPKNYKVFFFFCLQLK